MENHTTSHFWANFEGLPKKIQQRAVKQFQRFREDRQHPSLNFKLVSAKENVWSARVTQDYRAVAVKHEDHYLWFFIGTHAAYDKLLKGL